MDIIVSTPGRLLDLVEEGHCDLSEVSYLVLDEADRMLDLYVFPDRRASRLTGQAIFKKSAMRVCLLLCSRFHLFISLTVRTLLF